jgi:glutamate-1-semialdehyde 2,1-aminomutase
MVKFCKDGSTASTAAVTLARAYTNRDFVAICSDHPFLSYNDWFIGATPMKAGVPRAVQELTLTFRYNDLASLQALLDKHPGQVACVVLEPEREEEPRDGFLAGVQKLCEQAGALFVLDETITGFRWHLRGAQAVYSLSPDLSIFGKAIANGFSVSALLGRREIMELGGLRHSGERVFLLSTTHGAETHALAAAIATMRVYREQGVVEVLYDRGERLRAGIEAAARELGLSDCFKIVGRAPNLVYVTLDERGTPSQAFRALFLQEMIRRGFIAPSFVVSFSHHPEVIDQTVEAATEALAVYRKGLEDGVEVHLHGRPVKPVNRRFN